MHVRSFRCRMLVVLSLGVVGVFGRSCVKMGAFGGMFRVKSLVCTENSYALFLKKEDASNGKTKLSFLSPRQTC